MKRTSPQVHYPFAVMLILLASYASSIADDGQRISTQGTTAQDSIHVSPRGNDRNPGTEAAPLATLDAALDKLADRSKSGQAKRISVVLHAGTYRLVEPLIIEPRHVPRGGRIEFVAASNASPVVSGGRPITDWKRNDDGTFSAHIAQVADGDWTFRELFVGGQRRPRAHHPNQGFLRVVEAFEDKRTGFKFRPGDLPNGVREGAELVFLHDWSTSRVPVKSVDYRQHRLTVAQEIGCNARHYQIDHFEPHPRYYIESDPALLDQPGEWYLDERSGVVTYRPLPGESPDNLDAVAPVVRSLLVVRGVETQPVRDVHFRGITFAHAAWPLPPGGFAAGQATVHEQRDPSQPRSPRKLIPTALTFELAEDCSVVECRLTNLGTSGIAFGSRTKRCRLERSVLEDISGNSVNLGEDTSRRVDGKPWWREAPEQAASHHIVANNVIRDGGRQFLEAVGIWVGLAHHIHIHHNEICRLPYSGISLGWMWNPSPTPAADNVVEHNDIHHVMQVLSDGGGIYTLGRQPRTELSRNHIHDIPPNAGRAESNGMFLDQGSDQITIAGNAIHGVARSPLRFHQAAEVLVKENILVVPDEKTPPIRYNATNPDTIRKQDNTVVTADKFDRPSAQSIVDAAGVETSTPRK
jgi:hypothetical protein